MAVMAQITCCQGPGLGRHARSTTVGSTCSSSPMVIANGMAAQPRSALVRHQGSAVKDGQRSRYCATLAS